MKWLGLALAFLGLPAAAGVAVTDDLGRTVALDAPAQRVVTLAPHAAEMLFAVGAGERIVGAVSYTDYPAAARDIPRVGSYDAADYERILAQEPDLVIAWPSGNGVGTIERLESLGLTVYASEPRALGDIATALDRLGRLTGHPRAGTGAAEAFRDRLANLRTGYAGRPTVTAFYEIWHRPLMTVNGDHLISRVIELCGGRNVFADLGPLVPTVSTEAVLARDPEAILAAGMSAARPEWLDDWRRWDHLTAARRGNLFNLDPDLIHRATPRILDGAAAVCRHLETARERREAP